MLADIEGSGAIQQIWMTSRPAMARPDPAHLLGRSGAAVRRVPARRFLRLRLGPVCAGIVARGVRQSRPRLQLLLGNAVPQARAHHDGEPRSRRERHHLLPDQLHTDRSAGGRRLLPRPVPPHQSAAVQGGLHASSTASRGAATTSAPTWRGASTTPVGGAKAKSSSSWTATSEFPTICGTGTEDYFCGAYNFDGGSSTTRMDSRISRVHHPLRGPAAGHPARRHLSHRSSVSACIAGTSWIRSASSEDLRVTIQALGWRTTRRIAVICRCRTTSLRSPSGIRPCRRRRSRTLPDRDYLEVI